MRTGKIEFFDCTQDHINRLKGKIRAQDLEEIQASSSQDPDKLLQHTFDYSVASWVAVRDEKIVCTWGVSSITTLSVVGIPWMIGSEELRFCDLELGRATCYYVNEMSRIYPRLENFIYINQKRTIKWLRWAGFTIEDPAPWGEFGKPFCKFWKE